MERQGGAGEDGQNKRTEGDARGPGEERQNKKEDGERSGRNFQK
jgi:hypothetical protein